MASAQVCSLPTASTATWLPPSVRRATAAGTSPPSAASDVLGAEVGRGDRERLGVAVHRDDPGAQGARDHHRAEPDPAGPDDGDPLALARRRARPTSAR